MDEFRRADSGPRYRLMTPERRSDIFSTAILVVVAAAWLWFLLAHADLISGANAGDLGMSNDSVTLTLHSCVSALAHHSWFLLSVSPKTLWA